MCHTEKKIARVKRQVLGVTQSARKNLSISVNAALKKLTVENSLKEFFSLTFNLVRKVSTLFDPMKICLGVKRRIIMDLTRRKSPRTPQVTHVFCHERSPIYVENEKRREISARA